MHDIDFDEADKVKGGYIKKFLLHPPFWVEPKNQVAFPLKWKKYKFIPRNKKYITKEKGIYCFVIEPNVNEFFNTRYLFYIGKTNRQLNIRFGEYMNEHLGKKKSRVKVKNMLKKYYGHIYFYFTPIATKAQVNQVEDQLIDTFIPQVNVIVKRAKINPEYQYLYE